MKALSLVAILAAFLVLACDDQEVDEGDSRITDTLDANQEVQSDVQGDQLRDEAEDLVEAVEIVVSIDSVDASANLNLLEASDNKVVMAEAIGLVLTEGELSNYTCDFVAADGFRTSSKGEGCEPIDCSTTVDAFIDLSTLDVSWDPTLGIRGCYMPSDLARIELTAN